MFGEVDPLFLLYFTFLLAALFAVGGAFILAIAPGWVLCVPLVSVVHGVF